MALINTIDGPVCEELLRKEVERENVPCGTCVTRLLDFLGAKSHHLELARFAEHYRSSPFPTQRYLHIGTDYGIVPISPERNAHLTVFQFSI